MWDGCGPHGDEKKDKAPAPRLRTHLFWLFKPTISGQKWIPCQRRRGREELS